jgi:hypothetical protein
MDLDRLSKALGTFDTAAYIFSLDDGKTLQKCLEIADAANSYDDQIEAGVRKVIKGPNDNEDPATIKGALKNATGHDGSTITVGKNNSPLALHGKPVRRAPKLGSLDQKDNSSAAFSKAGNQVSKTQSSMSEAEYIEYLAGEKFMSEDQITNHRSANKELDWVDGSQRNKVRIVKSAVLKSLANRKACEEEFNRYKLRPVVENMLRKKAEETRALKEANTTAAARTIESHYKGPSSLMDQMPAAFNPHKAALLDATKEITVAERLPEEWRSYQKDALSKQKDGVMRTWNDAQNSLKVKPNKMASPLDDKVDYQQNTNIPHVDGMTQTQLPQPAVGGLQKDGRSIGAETYKKFPNSQKQQFPHQIPDTGGAIEDGRGGYTA